MAESSSPILRSEALGAPAAASLGASLRAHLAMQGALADEALQKLMARPSLTREEARECFGAENLEGLQALGVIDVQDGALVPRFSVRLIAGLLIITDLPLYEHARRPAEYVDPLWETPGLVKMLVASPGDGEGLELGCGAGLIALVLAQRMKHVAASDVNPRALELTRLNAALNGITNIETVYSDLFGAFPGKRFDHIVFNSPTSVDFGGVDMMQVGESILQRTFEELPQRLTERGIIQISFSGKEWPGRTTLNSFDGWLGAEAGGFQMAFLEQWRFAGGRRFLLDKLKASFKYRMNVLACRALMRGWLTVRRADAAESREISENYQHWMERHPGVAPAPLIEAMLDPARHAAGLPPELAALYAKVRPMERAKRLFTGPGMG